MKSKKKPALVHDAYPLRTVSAMTGLSADLIRAWEKRYGVVSPLRGPRGARLFSSADIAHLRLLARVVKAGRAIGDVAALSAEELQQLAGAGRQDTSHPRTSLVDRIIEHLERFEHAAVGRVLGEALMALGGRRFVYEVAVPLLSEVGNRWQRGEFAIADEHVLTGMLRNILAGLLQTRTQPSGPRVVLATPAGERHDLGLLLVALLAQDSGAEVVNLGADLPAEEIVSAARRANAVVVCLSLVSRANRSQAAHAVEQIQRDLPPSAELWLGGSDATAVAPLARSFLGRVIGGLTEVERELATLAGTEPPKPLAAPALSVGEGDR